MGPRILSNGADSEQHVEGSSDLHGYQTYNVSPCTGKMRQPSTAAAVGATATIMVATGTKEDEPARTSPRVWFDPCLDNSHVVNAVDIAIVDLLEQNQQLLQRKLQPLVTRFDASKPPSISVRQYLERITKYAPCSSQCYTVALIYINRLCDFNPDFVVSSINVHRLLITSIMLAVKFYDDFFYNNAYFAKVGGVKPQEINMLELEFLAMIKYDLQVRQDVFLQAWSHLLPRTTCSSQCLQRDLLQKHEIDLHGVPVLSLYPTAAPLVSGKRATSFLDSNDVVMSGVFRSF